jgi:hypothetical protein
MIEDSLSAKVYEPDTNKLIVKINHDSKLLPELGTEVLISADPEGAQWLATYD